VRNLRIAGRTDVARLGRAVGRTEDEHERVLQQVDHFARPGGHIALVAGSKANKEIWPDIAAWLGERSDR
jgi:hypothetical protein